MTASQQHDDDREPAVTLRARLTAALLAVVLGPVLIGAVLVGTTVTTLNSSRSAERLDAAATAVRTTLNGLCSALRNSAETAAALAEGGDQIDRTARLARQVVRRGEAAAARVLDQTGRTVVQIGSLDGSWAVCGARTPTHVGEGTGRVGALAWQAELRDADDAFVGRLLLARPVDANLVNSLARTAEVEVVVVDGRDPPLSTISEERSRRFARTAGTLSDGAVHQTEEGWYVRSVGPGGRQPLRLVLATSRGEEQTLFGVLLAMVVVTGLLAIVAAWWLARSTTRPLAELALAADRVAGGDLDARVPVRSTDEVGRLATAFNRMTREMRGYVDALTASRDQLRGNLGLLGDTLSSTHDLERILEVILETATAATGARAGVVLLLEQTDNRGPGVLRGRCARGLGPELDDPGAIRLSPGEGLLGGVAASGEPRRGRVEWDGPVLSSREPRCRTYVAVPFSGSRHGDSTESASHPGRLLGVLALYDRLGHDEFDDADLITLRTFAGQVAVAVENVLLHEETHRLSLTDPLTGLWNYRYLRESVRREVKRANRFGRTLTVLALDLDRFKDVNDTYGHPAGDAVLVEFARRVRAEIREVDLAFRQGGDEFVVLLPETDVDGGAKVAQRLCAAIREVPFEVDTAGGRETVRVTVSAGVAVYSRHGTTDVRLLEAADDALYAAKAGGRDTHRTAPDA